MNTRKEILKEQKEAEFYNRLITDCNYFQTFTLGDALFGKVPHSKIPKNAEHEAYGKECCRIILMAYNAGMIDEHFKTVADMEQIGVIEDIPCFGTWDSPNEVLIMPKTDTAKVALWASETLQEILNPSYNSIWKRDERFTSKVNPEDLKEVEELARKLKFV